MNNDKSGDLTVLIADDSAALRERLVEIFSEVRGLNIVGLAEDVATATAAIAELKPEVVILDIQMSGGTGIDVLCDLKRSYPSTVAIMLTNHLYPQYRQKCLELGADYFLSKSIDMQLLIDIVRHLATAKDVIDE